MNNKINKINKSQFFSTREETSRWLDRYRVRDYIINDDLTVDVDGDVNISRKNLKSIPIKFKNITGNFWCNYNELTSLIGSPESVGFNFWGGDNKLISLEGSPESVGGSFSCVNNCLTDLVGSPKVINNNFYCDNNRLINLIGAPKNVGGDFWCQYNKLTSLEGAVINIAQIGGKIIFILNEKRFKNKGLCNFLNKYYNNSQNRIEIEFKTLRTYLEKLELEKNLKVSSNIKSKKIVKKSYL